MCLHIIQGPSWTNRTPASVRQVRMCLRTIQGSLNGPITSLPPRRQPRRQLCNMSACAFQIMLSYSRAHDMHLALQARLRAPLLIKRTTCSWAQTHELASEQRASGLPDQNCQPTKWHSSVQDSAVTRVSMCAHWASALARPDQLKHHSKVLMSILTFRQDVPAVRTHARKRMCMLVTLSAA